MTTHAITSNNAIFNSDKVKSIVEKIVFDLTASVEDGAFDLIEDIDDEDIDAMQEAHSDALHLIYSQVVQSLRDEYIIID